MPIGSAQWQYVPELVRAESEPLVAKRFPDAFEETDFEAILAERGIGSIIVAGALTDECIRGTLHGALTRGYDATLVEDAHTADDRTEWGAPPPEQVVALTNLYWKFNEAPGRIADTVATADLTF
jgi:nicotinamidase-related amidase